MTLVLNGTTGVSAVDGSASTPAIQGNDTNTGVFFPAADTVAIATGGTERLRADSSGNFQFNSGYGSVVIAYGCRAWVNFNGSGTVAINGSGNVSSITDNGVGNYTVNFTNALVDTNYGISSFVRKDNTSTDAAICATALSTSTKTTSALQIYCLFRNPTSQGTFDSPEVGVSIFR